jgi:DNA-directed RNA polymerase omega subunit
MKDIIPLDVLEAKVDSLYEAVNVIAKRARQINELQRRMIERQNEGVVDDDDDEFDESTYDRDIVDRQYLKLPKPTTIALQEMMDDKLEFEYLDKKSKNS